jgi:glycosyltransferase involved in cell wall biosynthesis
VDAELFHPSKRDRVLRTMLGADDETPVALYAGRIAAEKNLALAIRAFQHIQRSHPGARCVFAGGGPRVEALRAAHPEFHFVGACDDDLLARHYASADIFVFPSLTETYGNVIAEAMASGLVTVAFDYAAGQKLIRHGETGFLAPFGDEDAFLTQVDAALAHWQADSMRADARRAVEPLAWSDIVAQFERELTGPSVLPSVPTSPTLLHAHA